VILRNAGASRRKHRFAARRCVLGAFAALIGRPSAGTAQIPPADSLFRVEGRVVRGTRRGQDPVPSVWVVLHRVGADVAGPLDSTRTSPRGSYAFRYRPFGDSSAIYFVSSSYGGIAYFTPLRAPVVLGDDATITVFDTTSGPIPISIAGHHVIVGAPQSNGRRPVGEVFDLQNDTTVTLIARDSTPLWTTRIPDRAERFQLNPNTDIAPSAVTHRSGTVGLFAPLSPGVRQFAFTYELPRGEFPVVMRVAGPTGVLEVLVQEQDAKVAGARLTEVDPVVNEGRSFRRFLAKDVPAGSSVRIDAPVVAVDRKTIIFGVLVAIALGMLGALITAIRRRTTAAAATTDLTGAPASKAVLEAITTLDIEFERSSQPTDVARAEYEARRSTLKTQLAAALAAERRRA
jgi:hypothetical protein